MFRRRTSSSGKIHYRVNINKNMCLGVVDIYIEWKEGDLVLPGLPRPTTASRSFWLLHVLSLTGYQKFISLEQNYNHF